MWYVALVRDALADSALLSFSMLMLTGIVGLLPPIVLLFLSREEPQTTAAVIRDVEAGR